MKKIKKAQLKIQQMSIMLIAVFIFFVMVFLFFAIIQTAGWREEARTLERERIAGMATKLASSPEFNFGLQPNSVDADKVMILKSKKNYSELLGVKGVIIEKVYPKNEKECKMSNYPDCGVIKLFNPSNISTGDHASIFIALCRKQISDKNSYDKCEIARMIIDAKDIS